MKKVLVTGATGFVGRQSLPLLLAGGDEVHAVSSKVYAGVHPAVCWHQANLLNSEQVFDLIKRVQPTHLLHFAWSVVPGKFWTSLENFKWVQSSLVLLQEFAKWGGQRVVVAGTCAEYDWRYGYCKEGVTPLSPTTVYGTCKNALREMMDAFIKQTGLSGAWGRIFCLYGPYEHPERLVPLVIRSVIGGERVPCSHGNQIRDYLHVQDVADAFVRLLESDVEGPVNIGSGCPVSLKSIINGITNKLGRQDLIDWGAILVPQDDPRFLVADRSRLSDEVGWHPKQDLVSGLEQTVSWWEQYLSTPTTGMGVLK